MWVSSYKKLVLCPTRVCWRKMVMVTRSVPSHLVMHFRWFGPRLIQSISRNVSNRKKALKQLWMTATWNLAMTTTSKLTMTATLKQPTAATWGRNISFLPHWSRAAGPSPPPPLVLPAGTAKTGVYSAVYFCHCLVKSIVYSVTYSYTFRFSPW